MLLLVAAVLLAQPVEVTVVVSKRTAVSSAQAARLAEQLRAALLAADVRVQSRADTDARLGRMGQPDATFCAGKRSCLIELARQLPAQVLVGLSLTELKPDFAVSVEAVAPDGSVKAHATAVSPADAVDLTEAFAHFARELSDATAVKPSEPPPPPPPEVDRAPKVTPPPPDVLPPAVTTAARRPRWPAFAVGGAGIAAAISSVTLVALAFSTHAKLNDETQSLSLALGRLDRANQQMSAGIGCAVAAVALLVAGLLLYPWGEPR